MSGDHSGWLLLLGPAGAAGFYWAMYRYYRNTDKSHAFERETEIRRLSLTGAEHDIKVDEIRGTRESRIRGDNLRDYRRRVRRVPYRKT